MKSRIKSIIRRILSSLAHKENKPTVNPVLHNVFKTAHTKTALVSYIKAVFDNPEFKNDLSHTNRYTTYIIAETFSQLGYNVDIINYAEENNFDFTRYDIVFGLGFPLDYVIANRAPKSKTKVIWFGTGCSPLFSNIVTLRRVKDFYNKSGLLLMSSSRYIKEDWPLQHTCCDWMVLHGQSFAKSTYDTDKVSCIDAPVFMFHSVQKNESEWNEAKQHYLWFGSIGLLHRGLDLVIDAFKKLPHLHLHICVGMQGEPEFYNYYKETFDDESNITYHGFIDVKSDVFVNLLKKCAFAIYASASEGNSPAVITCMANGGLIPVVSRNADVEVEDYGIIIDDLTIEAVTKSVEESQALPISELIRRSNKLFAHTRRVNSFDYFKDDFRQRLQLAIKSIQS